MLLQSQRTPFLPPMAWRSAGLIAGGVVAVLIALSPLYGYHRGELYLRMLGERPAWGYFDQPPLTPMLARLSVELFGDTVSGLRVIPALFAGLLIVASVAITRELGGGRSAQRLCAAGVGTGMFPLIAGHTLLSHSADFLFWAVCLLFVLRALVRGDGRWWLAAGAVAGAATFNKHLIVLLVTGVATGLLITVGLVVKGPRAVFAERWFWAGAGIAALVASPNLIYQMVSGWPQLALAAGLTEADGAANRIAFVPLLVLLLSLGATVIAVAGLRQLYVTPATRSLSIAAAVTIVLAWVAGGRADYVAGTMILLFAAGCVPVAEWMARPAAGVSRPVKVWAGLVGGSVAGVMMALPILPVGTTSYSPSEVPRDSVGWSRFAAQVQEVFRDQPSGTVVVTSNYGQAGALDRYAPGVPVYSGHNELWSHGPPPETAETVVALGLERTMARHFSWCERAGQIDNGVGVDNEEQGEAISVCGGPRSPWKDAWADYHHAD